MRHGTIAQSMNLIDELLDYNIKTINWGDFEKVELMTGTIIEVNDFPEVRKPAYKLLIDFGGEVGLKKLSAQITHLYSREDLLGKQIIGVVNFASKQIGPLKSYSLLEATPTRGS